MLTSIDDRTVPEAPAQLEIPTTWGRSILVNAAGSTPGQMEDDAADLLETAGELMRAAGALRRMAKRATDQAVSEMLDAERV